ncbi:MAG: Fic family protein [Candidatus Buchananbacteria bacterium]|nr:Fic family protein [Candidatus Buchananbacteria bacterium]
MGVSLSKKESEFLIRFIVESDAIEGVQADPKLVSKQLEQRQTDGHVGAILLLDSLAKNKQPLTPEIIQQVQGLITAEQHTKPGGEELEPENIGQYRLGWVKIGGRICPSPQEVPALMEAWLSQVNAWQKNGNSSFEKKLGQIAKLHWDYEFIHPFADGNGRSGRAIVYYLMLYGGLKPFIFTADNRFATYYPAFRSPKDMQWYFRYKYLNS